MVLITLDAGRYDLLSQLEQNGAMNSTSLMESAGMLDSRNRFSTGLKLLRESGYIKSKDDPKDARKRIHSITREGRQALNLHRKPANQ